MAENADISSMKARFFILILFYFLGISASYAKCWDLKSDKDTHFTVVNGAKSLTVRLISGSVQARASAKCDELLTFDFGTWELQKKSGSVKVSGTSSDAWVNNQTEALWVRQDELLKPVREIPAAIQFRLQANQDLFFAFQKNKTPEIAPTWKLGGGRKPASDKDSSLCTSPAGDFQKCAWKCFGKKNKRLDSCETGDAKTHCVRFMCAADGQWKMPTLVSGGECSAGEIRVDQCR